MQGAYTFSRSFDSASYVDAGALGSSFQFPQNPDRLDLEYGLSDFDRTHRFTGSVVWDLPFGRGQWFFKRPGLGQKLFSGMQLNSTATIQTGRPFTPKLPTADFTGQRPDLLGDPLQNVPAVDGTEAKDIPHQPVINAFAERAKKGPQRVVMVAGADTEMGRKRTSVQQLIATYRNVGARWADLDPLKRAERERIPELGVMKTLGFSSARVLRMVLGESLLLALGLVAILGPALINAMIAIAVVYLPHFVRLARASVLAEKDKEYVIASRNDPGAMSDGAAVSGRAFGSLAGALRFLTADDLPRHADSGPDTHV